MMKPKHKWGDCFRHSQSPCFEKCFSVLFWRCAAEFVLNSHRGETVGNGWNPVLSDGCLKALLQRGTTDLKIQSLNLDLDVPREPIWVAAHYMKKTWRLQRPSLYSCLTVRFHRSLSDCTWALQKIMRLINEGISFAFLQRGMKNAAMFVSITRDVHVAENWTEVNPFAVERKPWMGTIGSDFAKGESTVVLRVKTHFRKATTLQKTQYFGW